jgi:membrane-associated phospholipid phosphatase
MRFITATHRSTFAPAGVLSLVVVFCGSTFAAAQGVTAVQTAGASSTVPAAFPAFSDLFTGTIGDFKRLPSRDTALILGLGGALALVGHTEDARVSQVMTGARSLEKPFEPGATIGAVHFQFGAALAAYSIGRSVQSPKLANVGADLFRAQVMSQALTQGIKFAVRRARPDGTSYSFPSGHTSTTFASATVLHRHFGWKVGIPAYAVATYVAASRIQEKRHFLSDVAFGAAIGIVSGRTVTIGRNTARFALTPMAAPGGGGIALNWIGAQR